MIREDMANQAVWRLAHLQQWTRGQDLVYYSPP